MSIGQRVKRLEKLAQPEMCTVIYKAMYSDLREEQLPIDTAMEAARAGRVKAISFHLSFNEEQAERSSGHAILDEIREEMQGIMRDTRSASVSSRFLLCTKPIVYAKQAPPRKYNAFKNPKRRAYDIYEPMFIRFIASSTTTGSIVNTPATSINFANGSFKPFLKNQAIVKATNTVSERIYDIFA